MSHQSVLVYQKPGFLLLEVHARTTQRMFVVDLAIPVQQFLCPVEPTELGNALRQLVLHARTGVAHPTDWKQWEQQWLVHLGTRSRRAFFKDCSVCAVDHSNGQFEIWATQTNAVGSSVNIGQPLVVSAEDASALGRGVLSMLAQAQR